MIAVLPLRIMIHSPIHTEIHIAADIYAAVAKDSKISFGGNVATVGLLMARQSKPEPIRHTLHYLPGAKGQKKRPHEAGVKLLRQVSYRQETYRAVTPLYAVTCRGPS
ncbi:MAG: hypothetical protein WBC90_01560 [Albidovulum sp.]